MLRVPVTRSDEDLAIDLLRQASVLVHPGHFYDFPSDGYLILSLLTPPGEFREGARRILKLLNTAMGYGLASDGGRDFRKGSSRISVLSSQLHGYRGYGFAEFSRPM